MLLAAVQLGGDLAWEWARPSGLWALFLPAILWVFSRLRAHPPSVPTGTLAFWKRVAASHPKHGSGSRRRTPPWAWCLIVALALGALGLAGPRLVAPDAPRTWTVVVDHSPSTALVLPNGETRLGRALDRAREWLATRMDAGDQAVWISSAHGLHEPTRGALRRGELPPGRWLIHPAWFAPEPRWEFFDLPGALWITDAVPAVVPVHAALIASGGDFVPGPISASGTTRFEYDGVDVTSVERAFARRALVLSGPLPEPVVALARLWAEERGLRVTDTAQRDQALELRGEAGLDPATALAVEVGRDGWRARVTAELGGLPPSELRTRAPQLTWLRADTVPIVHAAPGLVRLAFSGMEQPRGDPAAFACSWSRLFEDWMLPAPDVVALAERSAAGEAAEREGEPPAVPGRTPRADGRGGGDGRLFRGDELDSWLAAGSALLAAVALSFSRTRPGR